MQPSGIATQEKDPCNKMMLESSKDFWLDRYGWIVFLSTLAACLLLIHEGQYWGGDFAQYLSQARALINGNEAAWQQDSRFMIEHSPLGMGVEVAPWGYTFFLIPLILIFGENFLIFKIANAVLFAISSLLFYRLLLRLFPKNISFLTALIFGLTYQMLIYTNNVISDPLFLSMNLASYLFFAKWLGDSEKGFSRYGVLFGVFGYLSYLVKSQGLILFIALFCFQATILIREHGKNLVKRLPSFLAPYAVFAILFLVISKHLPSSSGSSFYFLNAVNMSSIVSNSKDYAGMFRYFMPLCYSRASFLNKLMYALIVLLVAVGIRRDKLLCYLGYVFLLMIGLLLIFPWPSGIRYLFSIYPILLVFMISGLMKISERYKIQWLTTAAAIILLIGFGTETAAMAYQNQYRGRTYEAGSMTKEAMDMYSYIRDALPEESIVIFAKPRVIYLETGRLSYNVTVDNVADIEPGTYFLDITFEPTEDIANRIHFLDDYDTVLKYSNKKFNLYLVTGKK